jgi:t-SNARE complex subunit (syntaxin)
MRIEKAVQRGNFTQFYLPGGLMRTIIKLMASIDELIAEQQEMQETIDDLRARAAAHVPDEIKSLESDLRSVIETANTENKRLDD